MQRTASRIAIALPSFILGSGLMVGCESAPEAVPPAPPVAISPEPEEAMQDDETLAAVERYAQQLQEAMAQPAAPAEPTPEPTAPPAFDIEWLQPGASPPADEGPIASANATASETAIDESPIADVDAEAEPTPAAAPEAVLTRQDLAARLLDDIAGADAAPLRRAIDAALLAQVEPEVEPQPILAELDSDQREKVERFTRTVAAARSAIESGQVLDVDAIEAHLEAIAGPQPIRIRQMELCRRVIDFGVYDPFESRTFLAGQEQKMVVYVELDHFHTQVTEEGRHEVRLEQEITLFNEKDSLAVWKSEPVQITDLSRNRRRDFFVVQLIALPPRVSVGKYALKVRISDHHGGSVDERTLPIEFVAQEALAQPANP